MNEVLIGTARNVPATLDKSETCLVVFIAFVLVVEDTQIFPPVINIIII